MSTWILLSVKEINKIRSLNIDRVEYNSGSDLVSNLKSDEGAVTLSISLKNCSKHVIDLQMV